MKVGPIGPTFAHPQTLSISAHPQPRPAPSATVRALTPDARYARVSHAREMRALYAREMRARSARELRFDIALDKDTPTSYLAVRWRNNPNQGGTNALSVRCYRWRCGVCPILF